MRLPSLFVPALVVAVIVGCSGTAAQTPLTLVASPAVVSPGKTYVGFAVTAAPGTLTGGRIAVPDGTGVTLSDFRLGNTAATMTLTVATDAPMGPVAIEVYDASNKLLGTATINVQGAANVQRQPTPNGIQQVDVIWDVLPDHITRDNFNGHVANEFYAVSLLIGNNSGYDLLLSGVGFARPLGETQAATSYRLVRGVLQRNMQEGLRARTIAAYGPGISILSAAVPLFGNAVQSRAAQDVVNVLAGPFQGLLTAAWPDMTVNEMARLEDQALQDGSVIHNNQQVNEIVFIPKRTVNSLLANYCGVPGRGLPECYTGGSKPLYEKTPDAVKAILGAPVIIGEQIQFLNRLVVAAAGASSVQLVSVSPSSVPANYNGQLVLQGMKFTTEATVLLAAPNPKDNLSIPYGKLVSPSATQLSVPIGGDDKLATGGRWEIYVQNSDGSATTRLPLTVTPELDAITTADGAAFTTATIKLKAAGIGLEGATLTFTPTSGGTASTSEAVSNGGFSLNAGLAAGTWTATATIAGMTSNPIQVVVTAAQPPKP